MNPPPPLSERRRVLLRSNLDLSGLCCRIDQGTVWGLMRGCMNPQGYTGRGRRSGVRLQLTWSGSKWNVGWFGGSVRCGEQPAVVQAHW